MIDATTELRIFIEDFGKRIDAMLNPSVVGENASNKYDADLASSTIMERGDKEMEINEVTEESPDDVETSGVNKNG